MSSAAMAVLKDKKDEPKKDLAKSSPHNPDYSGPYVEIGMMVLWFAQGNRNLKPTAAIVTGVGNQNVSVNLLTNDNRDMMLREGVFHLSDDRCRHPEMAEAGGWDYRPIDRRVLGQLVREQQG